MNILNIPILKRLYPSVVRRTLILLGKNEIKININNFIFNVDIRESIERKTYFLKSYEKDRMLYLTNTRRSNIFIDIGAHIGFYSILTSDYFKQIYSYEPNFRNYQKLQENIKQNKLEKKIRTFNYGLGEKKQEIKGISKNKGGLIQTSGFSISEKNKTGEDVLVLKGDNVVKLVNEYITIKIDVEGFEYNVLKGLKKTLKNNNCFLQIEIWDKNLKNVLSYLYSLNYQKLITIDGDTFFSKSE